MAVKSSKQTTMETGRQTLANEEMSFERREAKRRANLLSDSTQSSANACCSNLIRFDEISEYLH